MSLQKHKLLTLMSKLDNSFTQKQINESEENLPKLVGLTKLRNIVAGNPMVSFWFEPYGDGKIYDIIQISDDGIKVKNSRLDIVNINWESIKDNVVVQYNTQKGTNKIMFSLDATERNKHPYSQDQGKTNTVDQINEITPKMLGKVLKNYRDDDRYKQLLKDAVTSIFKKYINRDLDFYIKTGDHEDTLHKYVLIEVVFRYSSINNNFNAEFHFFNKDGVEANHQYADNRKNVIITYLSEKDMYEQYYHYNQYTVNFLINAAKWLREAYYTAFPVYTKTDDRYNKYEINQEETEKAKKTELNKKYFHIDNFNRNDLPLE